MTDKIQFIKKLCYDRGIVNDYIEEKNCVRLYPHSFDNSTLDKADLWEYVFKLDSPRLDTWHTSNRDGSQYTDIVVKK